MTKKIGKHRNPRICPDRESGIHYYAPISMEEGQCSCGQIISQNNSGH